ncbi:hypothetical protein Hanom_Chr03g00183961 [Helianthus anomalus]
MLRKGNRIVKKKETTTYLLNHRKLEQFSSQHYTRERVQQKLKEHFLDRLKYLQAHAFCPYLGDQWLQR